MEQQSYEINKRGAAMDYSEHQSTYLLFILLMKWGIVLNVALLAGLAIGFFTFGGIFGGMLTFFAIPAVVWYFS